MVCENSLCAYQKNNQCTLEEISINHLGMCYGFVQVNIKEDILLQAKDEYLTRVEQEDVYYDKL